MYTRHTELRRLHERDEYNLALKLTERDVWRLMEVIPHRINAQQCSNNGTLDWQQAINKDGCKYRHEHFELMKNAFRASGGTRLISQILLDEWKTSGRKEERPTLGVMLQLLVGAECWMAADFLATELLHETKPERPLDGPAARFDFPISEICEDVEDYMNGMASYPNTEDLAFSVNGFNSMNNNHDYRTKFIFDKQVLNAKTNYRDKMQTQNVSTEEQVNRTLNSNNIVPPPISTSEFPQITTTNTPNQQCMTIHNLNTTNPTTTTPTTSIENAGSSTVTSSCNIPLISTLMTRGSTAALASVMSQSTSTTDESSSATPSSAPPAQVYTFFSEVPIPNLSIFDITGNTEAQQMESGDLSNKITNTSLQISNVMLPELSELYINCDEQQQHKHNEHIAEHRSCSSSNSSLSNNEEPNNDTNDAEDVPNLSIFEQNSSNNDSSLTSVTCTSGENSFEISPAHDEQEMAMRLKNSLEIVQNNSEVISQDNIPCVSALQH